MLEKLQESLEVFFFFLHFPLLLLRLKINSSNREFQRKGHPIIVKEQ